MTVQTIAAMLGAQVAALDLTYGRQLLAGAWPTEVQAAQTDMIAGANITVERGQRFVEVRGIAVMPLRGVLTANSVMLEKYLGWSTFLGIEAVAQEVAARDDISALIVDVDSPGGFVVGCDAAVQALAALAAIKPVYALVNPLAASAAYWLASQATEITMTPGSVAGSIGVMQEAYAPVQPNGAGDQWSIHLSSHARAKRPNPTTERGQAEIQRQLDDIEALFLEAVAKGRGKSMDDLLAALTTTGDIADGGGVFFPARAVAIGLADRIETRAAFYNRVIAAHAPQAPRPQRQNHSAALQAQAAAARAIALT